MTHLLYDRHLGVAFSKTQAGDACTSKWYDGIVNERKKDCLLALLTFGVSATLTLAFSKAALVGRKTVSEKSCSSSSSSSPGEGGVKV
jgi:hypothetical protein